MNDNNGLVLLEEVGVINNVYYSYKPRRCNIIAVHGLGPEEATTWSWQQIGKNTPTEGIAKFLSLNDTISRFFAFRYPVDKLQQNIDINSVHILAHELLKELCLVEKDAFDVSDRTYVFVGNNLGGLIIKEALALARWTKKYHFIAANTTVLIFFETPHWAIPGETSWENLAHWLLCVSGWKSLSCVDWISKAAHMIELVCRNFGRSQRLHDVVNIATNENPGRGWKEKIKSLGWSTVLFNSDYSYSDETMLEICNKIKYSSAPGSELIRCLKMLATMSLAELRSVVQLNVRDRESKKASTLIKDYPALDAWSSNANGYVNITVSRGDDASIIFLKLIEDSRKDKGSSTAVINYVFRTNGFEADDATIVMASVCYQLLSQKPHLFQHVSGVVEAIERLDDDGVWPERMLSILLRSLLSCPLEGNTVCIMWERPGTTLTRSVLEQLKALAVSDSSNFKLAVISSEAVETFSDSLLVLQPTADFEIVLNDALDDFSKSCPGLRNMRKMLLDSFCAHYDKHRDEFDQSHREIGENFKVWLDLITRLVTPVSPISLKDAQKLIPSSIDEMYREALKQKNYFSQEKLGKILSWITLPLVSLDMDDLATALALDDNTESMEELKRNKPTDLNADLEAGFGAIVPIFDWRRPLHEQDLLTVLSHERKDTSGLIENTHLRLAKLCLIFLRLYTDHNVAELAASMDHHPFLEYAVSNWPVHYSKGQAALAQESESTTKFDEFFNNRALVDFWAGMHHQLQHPEVPTPDEYALAAAAEIGCQSLVEHLMENSNEKARSSALLAAIEQGNSELAKFFQEQGVTSPYSIHVAISTEQQELLQLVEPLKEEDLKRRNKAGYTPLHCACQVGSLEMVNRLLDSGADACSRSDKDGSTPLHVACMFGHVAVIERLVSEDLSRLSLQDENEKTPMDYACEYQQPDAVRAILKIPGALDGIVAKFEFGHLPFFFTAVWTGRADIVEMLLGLPNGGASIPRDIIDDNDGTALHLAAKKGHVEVTKTLLLKEVSKSYSLTLQDKNSNFPLHLACQMGHTEVVKLLLQHSPVDQLEASGDGYNYMKPIHLAVRHGHIDVVQVLADEHVKRGVTLDQFDQYPRSPLHSSALRGHILSAKLLLEHGATADILDLYEATPLLLACRHGYEDVAIFLVDYGANVKLADDSGMTPLLAAAHAGCVNVMKKIVEAGASWDEKDSNLRNVLHHVVCSNSAAIDFALKGIGQADSYDLYNLIREDDTDGECALETAATGDFLQQVLDECKIDVANELGNRMLHAAAGAGKLENVRYLVNNQKVSPNGQDKRKRTVLSFATELGHMDVVDFLAPITESLKDDRGRLPLHYACEKGHINMVWKLLENNEVSNMTDDDGMTPLCIAVSNNWPRIVQLLLKKKADPNIPDDRDRTPLHWAAEYGRDEILDDLLGAGGIKGEEKDISGRTPLYLALWYNHVGAARKLVEAGWTANFPQGSNGWYPIMAAYDNPETIQLLIKKTKMSVNIKGEDGNTTLHLAARNSCRDAVDCLIKLGADTTLANNYDDTPLHLVDNESIADMLLNSRPSQDWANKKNSEGQNVLQVAMVADRMAIVEHMMKFEGIHSCVDADMIKGVIVRFDTELHDLFRDWFTIDQVLEETDEHGWTYAQIADTVQKRDCVLPTGHVKLPSAWAISRDDAVLMPASEHEEGPKIQATFDTDYYAHALVLADRPVPPRARFYFVIKVIREKYQMVGVGLGRSGCKLDKMPGWEDDTWGLHGDNGGFYHASPFSIKEHDKYKYKTGDQIEVFVDTTAQKLFYSINGEINDTGFENVQGRVFPVVGLGPGCEVEVTFGSPDGQDLFKDENGVDQMDKVTNWIG